MTVIPEPGTRREPGSSSRPLLEREAELGALTAVVEVARGGDGRLVVVEGPAGIGKTRLLAEARLLASEFEVLSARAGELESGFAFGIVRQLFEGALAAAPSDVRAELLAGAAALAAPLFAVVPGDSGATGTETSFAMLHGLYWLTANFALRRPTLLVVDDLHWADDPSLRWLGYLARRLEGSPLLVMAATRPPEQAQTPGLVTEILDDPLATVIRPAALSQASAATLARVLFGLEPDEVFAGALRDASDGNPLYLAAILDAEVVSFATLPIPLAYRAACLAELLLARGQHAQAEMALADVRLDEVQPGHKILFLCSRGRLYLGTGRPEHALTDFRHAAEIAASIGMENPAFCPWRSHAALALHRLGRGDEALPLAQQELELSRRWGAPRTIGISLRALGLVEGGTDGGQLLREAVEVLGGSPARLEHARALIDLGAALRRGNSRTEARTHLRAGVDLAHQCGAPALVTRGNEELAATGAHPRTVTLSGLESLTASERRVAQMAAEEVSNKEIAQTLFVTVKTVEMHLSRVYRKLDIESRRQLAVALSAPGIETAANS